MSVQKDARLKQVKKFLSKVSYILIKEEFKPNRVSHSYHLDQFISVIRLFFICLCHIVLSVSCSLAVTCWKGLTSWLSCMWRFVIFCHLSIRCPGSGVLLGCIVSWSLPSFLLCWVAFSFYTNVNSTFCKPTVEILTRRYVLWRPIWVCSVCQCPTNRAIFRLYSMG